VYEQFFRRVRAVNWTLPPGRRIRVLLGDPPFDWSTVTSHSQIPLGQRDPHAASVVEQQVLAKGRTYVIKDLIPQQGDPGGLATKLAPYPRGTIISAAGTWLGQFNAGDAEALYELQGGKQVNPFCGTLLGQHLDAGLYLGQPADLTTSWPNPAIYLDPAYWAELQRRNSLQGNNVELNSYLQEHPPARTLPLAVC
jgi:hypothetical protein